MSHFFVELATFAFLTQLARISLPYLLAAIGGTFAERSGVVDLALEGKLLAGAFTAVLVSHLTGSAWWGLVGGATGGLAIAGLHALFAVVWAADHVVVGVALNLVVLGLTRFLLSVIFGSTANSPVVDSLSGPLPGNPVLWIGVAAFLAAPLVMKRSRFGLRLRAAGDRPDALAAVGVSTRSVRVGAVLVGGVLVGLGGAELSLSLGGFTSEMSGGRGYIALAAVILSGWRPARAALICLGFAAAEAIAIRWQIWDRQAPAELLSAIPYLLTLVALIVAKQRMTAPSALGTHPGR